MFLPFKDTGGSRDTHGTHTGQKGAHGHTDHTDEPHNHPSIHPNPPKHTTRTTRRQRDDRNRGRLNSRSPGYRYRVPVIPVIFYIYLSVVSKGICLFGSHSFLR